jgi:hypothetical protein
MHLGELASLIVIYYDDDDEENFWLFMQASESASVLSAAFMELGSLLSFEVTNKCFV